MNYIRSDQQESSAGSAGEPSRCSFVSLPRGRRAHSNASSQHTDKMWLNYSSGLSFSGSRSKRSNVLDTRFTHLSACDVSLSVCCAQPRTCPHADFPTSSHTMLSISGHQRAARAEVNPRVRALLSCVLNKAPPDPVSLRSVQI